MLNEKVMRSQFEAAYLERITSNEAPSETLVASLMPRNADGSYVSERIEMMWWIWQESRRALLTAPLAVEPDIYLHQLLDHEQKPTGVYLGGASKEVVIQSKIPGETEDAVHAFYSADNLKLALAVSKHLAADIC